MTFSEFDIITLAVIAVAFVLAGLSKGFIGFGLPLISVPLCSSVVSVMYRLYPFERCIGEECHCAWW